MSEHEAAKAEKAVITQDAESSKDAGPSDRPTGRAGTARAGGDSDGFFADFPGGGFTRAWIRRGFVVFGVFAALFGLDLLVEVVMVTPHLFVGLVALLLAIAFFRLNMVNRTVRSSPPRVLQGFALAGAAVMLAGSWWRQFGWHFWLIFGLAVVTVFWLHPALYKSK